MVESYTNNSEQENAIALLKQALTHAEQKKAEYEQFDRISAEKAHLAAPNGGALFMKGVLLGVVLFLALSITGIIFLISADAAIIGFVGVFAVFLPIRWYRKGNAKYRAKMAELDKQLLELKQLLEQHYFAYSNFPVAFEYSPPAVLSELMRLISTGRADNIKEAINCMIEDMHRHEMLQVQKETARNAKDAANAANTAALFSAATFINSRK